MLILSHRGYCATAHENTLDAFQAAVSFGVDGFETDLRLTSDGVIVLHHDRTIANKIPIETLDYPGLCRRAAYPIARLEEALHAFPGMYWNLEIKSPAVVDPLVQALRAVTKPEQFLITAFRHQVVKDLCDQLPLAGGILVAHLPIVSTDLRAWLPNSRCIDTIVWDWESCDQAVVTKATASGIKSIAYGISSADERQQFEAWGGIGVITDYPDVVKK